MDKKLKDIEIESLTFKKFLDHLQENTDVQNIELMNLANFCRNCISKWYVSSAKEKGIDITYEEARELIYGMPYSEWKALYQTEASDSQKELFEKNNKK
mgnify:CR=1 FL=1